MKLQYSTRSREKGDAVMMLVDPAKVPAGRVAKIFYDVF